MTKGLLVGGPEAVPPPHRKLNMIIIYSHFVSSSKSAAAVYTVRCAGCPSSLLWDQPRQQHIYNVAKFLYWLVFFFLYQLISYEPKPPFFSQPLVATWSNVLLMLSRSPQVCCMCVTFHTFLLTVLHYSTNRPMVAVTRQEMLQSSNKNWLSKCFIKNSLRLKLQTRPQGRTNWVLVRNSEWKHNCFDKKLETLLLKEISSVYFLGDRVVGTHFSFWRSQQPNLFQLL